MALALNKFSRADQEVGVLVLSYAIENFRFTLN